MTNRLLETSFTSGHKHFWSWKRKFTTKNSGHRHKINKKKRLALPIRKGSHRHRLLKRR